MPRPPKPTKARLSLVLTPAARERLARVQTLGDADSMSEAVRRALAVYETMLAAQHHGYEIVVRSEGAETRVLLT